MRTIVISLGGSIIVPDKIDTDFLLKFKRLVEDYLKKGFRFIIVTGGGQTCRQYQKAASKVARLHPEDLDWIGIHATRLNAHLLRSIFRKHAVPAIVKDYSHPPDSFKERILIGAGWKPGWSTDYDTVILARKYKADTIVNLTNCDYVYDKDPKKSITARPMEKISWDSYRKIAGGKWVPGMNLPFDPVASKEAKASRLRVVILNGANLQNLRDFLDNRKFRGTIIS